MVYGRWQHAQATTPHARRRRNHTRKRSAVSAVLTFDPPAAWRAGRWTARGASFIRSERTRCVRALADRFFPQPQPVVVRLHARTRELDNSSTSTAHAGHAYRYIAALSLTRTGRPTSSRSPSAPPTSTCSDLHQRRPLALSPTQSTHVHPPANGPGLRLLVTLASPLVLERPHMTSACLSVRLPACSLQSVVCWPRLSRPLNILTTPFTTLPRRRAWKHHCLLNSPS